MRVIAGQWRGRTLHSPRGDDVRPTTDRVKEALFSILGRQVLEAVVLDLCCGAGGLAVEALSRGARKAILVDRSRRHLETARRNLADCGAAPGSFELVCADCERWLAGWSPVEGPVLLLADPPYGSDLPVTLIGRAQDLVRQMAVQTAVIEHGPALELASVPGELDRQTRRYGQSHLTIIRPGAGLSAQNEETS